MDVKKILYALLLLSITVIAVNNMVIAGDKPIRYSVVIVEHGDTLWSIASKHCSNDQDIRDVIVRVKQENHLDRSVQIHPGQMLRIPVSNKNSGFWAILWNR